MWAHGFVFSFVRSYNFGWSPVYDFKAYLETNTAKNCSYFGLGEYFLVAETRDFLSAYRSLMYSLLLATGLASCPHTKPL